LSLRSTHSEAFIEPRLSGPGLAHDLLSEVMAMPYEDPDGVTGATSGEGDISGPGRSGFDDIDDYDNWDSPNAVAKDGAALPGYTGWQRQVEIQWCRRDTGAAWTFW